MRFGICLEAHHSGSQKKKPWRVGEIVSPGPSCLVDEVHAEAAKKDSDHRAQRHFRRGGG